MLGVGNNVLEHKKHETNMQMAKFALTEVKKTLFERQEEGTAEHIRMHHCAFQPPHGETFVQKKQKGRQHLGVGRKPGQRPPTTLRTRCTAESTLRQKGNTCNCWDESQM